IARTTDADRVAGNNGERCSILTLLPQDAIGFGVGDIQTSVRPQRNTCCAIRRERSDRLIRLRPLDAADDAGHAVDDANAVVPLIGDINVACVVNSNVAGENNGLIGWSIFANASHRRWIVAAYNVFNHPGWDDDPRVSPLWKDGHIGICSIQEADVAAAAASQRSWRAHQRAVLRIDDINAVWHRGQSLRR